jgi:hypothetical protein
MMSSLGAAVLILFVWGVETPEGHLVGTEIRKYETIQQCEADLPKYDGSIFIKAICENEQTID